MRAHHPSVLRHCWLGGRKGIRPVKNWVVGCWCGCLSGARCRLVYGPADATATQYSLSLAAVKSRLVLPFWYRLTWVVLEKEPLNGCVCVCEGASQNNHQSVICIPVSIDRLEQQWFQFATKSSGRAQQLQFCWQQNCSCYACCVTIVFSVIVHF